MLTCVFWFTRWNFRSGTAMRTMPSLQLLPERGGLKRPATQRLGLRRP